MRSFKTEAIIIKRRDFGEADRLLTVFSKHSGKIKIKAKGVRKINSRRGAHVELLTQSALTLYTNAKIPILTEAQTIRPFKPLKNDLEIMGAAFHICELIDGLCAEHQENFRVYELIKKTLDELETTKNIDLILNIFEQELLRNLGFWPKEKILEEKNSQYVIENLLERRLRSKKIISSLA